MSFVHHTTVRFPNRSFRSRSAQVGASSSHCRLSRLVKCCDPPEKHPLRAKDSHKSAKKVRARRSCGLLCDIHLCLCVCVCAFPHCDVEFVSVYVCNCRPGGKRPTLRKLLSTKMRRTASKIQKFAKFDIQPSRDM